MNKFWVIVEEVYKKNVKSLGFMVMVLAPIVIIAIISAVIYFIATSEAEIPEIAVLTDDQEVQEVFRSQEETFSVDTAVTTQGEAEEALEAEEIDGFLTVTEENGILAGEYFETNSSESLDLALLAGLLTSVQQGRIAAELELENEQVAQLMTPVEVDQISVSFDEDSIITDQNGTGNSIRTWSAYAVVIAIFMFIITYSSTIAEEIASEKGTRIMEVILSSVSSSVHFFGKLLGILLVCLTQIVIYAVIGVIGYQFARSTEFVQNLLQGVDVFSILQGLIGFTLIYFVLGIILFSGIAAFLGSLVSKAEDVNKVVSPLIFLSLIGFYAGLFAFASPNHLIVRIASYVPLFTPFVMPFRVASETVTLSGNMTAIAVMVIFTLACTYLSLIMYRSNVLVYSDEGMFKTIKASLSIMQNEKK